MGAAHVGFVGQCPGGSGGRARGSGREGGQEREHPGGGNKQRQQHRKIRTGLIQGVHSINYA